MKKISEIIQWNLSNNSDLTYSEKIFLKKFELKYLFYHSKTIKDISTEFNISTATITRAIQKIKLNTWSQTKSLIIQEINEKNLNYKIDDVKEKSNEFDLKNNELSNDVAERILSKQTISNIQLLAKEIKRKEFIAIYALGFAVPLAEYLARGLLIKGINTKLLIGSSSYDLLRYQKNHVIYISFSGRTVPDIFSKNKKTSSAFNWIYISGSTNYSKDISDQFEKVLFPSNIMSSENYKNNIPDSSFLATAVIVNEILKVL